MRIARKTVIMDVVYSIDVDLLSHFNILYAHGISHLLGFDHEKDEDYVKMAAFEKKLLDNYSLFMAEYDPLEQGLYESWNWDKECPI